MNMYGMLIAQKKGNLDYWEHPTLDYYCTIWYEDTINDGNPSIFCLDSTMVDRIYINEETKELELVIKERETPKFYESIQDEVRKEWESVIKSNYEETFYKYIPKNASYSELFH